MLLLQRKRADAKLRSTPFFGAPSPRAVSALLGTDNGGSTAAQPSARSRMQSATSPLTVRLHEVGKAAHMERGHLLGQLGTPNKARRHRTRCSSIFLYAVHNGWLRVACCSLRNGLFKIE